MPSGNLAMQAIWKPRIIYRQSPIHCLSLSDTVGELKVELELQFECQADVGRWRGVLESNGGAFAGALTKFLSTLSLLS